MRTKIIMMNKLLSIKLCINHTPTKEAVYGIYNNNKKDKYIYLNKNQRLNYYKRKIITKSDFGLGHNETTLDEPADRKL